MIDIVDMVDMVEMDRHAELRTRNLRVQFPLSVAKVVKI